MKKLHNSMLLIVLVTFSLSCMHLSGQQKLKTFNYNGKNLNYTILLPLDFDSSKTYPLIVGPSETDSANDQSFYWRGTTDSRGWILVGYKVYNATNRIEEVKALFEHLKSKYNIEGNKFHTVCFSANSASIFDLVMEMPEYFAGITGMAGNPSNSNTEKMKQLKGIKVQFIVGDRDRYWMNSAKKSHQILQSIEVESSIEVIKNGEHVLKPLIGKGFLDRAKRLRD
ncbi:hypothetical protein ATE84_4687 [Aquimarina sp. MAR_2010_214]|uniref:hypothetical protein n=1 Tax=Aquimarina sp. MAR_2010_214 TaxID=1250026 RepID=UPI000CC28510|nr:hypothetical protein [Aquimarina sp. MAR_2010_214]PKV52567.1 hypothetical protein ATE84_4687 [Aquimarina sp. MAR_2010_214]